MAQATKQRPTGRPVSSGPTRTRTSRRRGAPSTRQGAAAATGTSQRTAQPKRSPGLTLPGGIGITRRAIALLVVVVMLGISYANSVRIYFSQEAEIVALGLEAEHRQAEIDDLNYELTRWQDENYVKAMARDRLGWVVPGEVGYRVIGADGQPIGSRIEREAPVPAGDAAPEAPWWETMAGGIDAADHPQPVEEPVDPAEEPPLTSDGKAPSDEVEEPS